jgi:hypothetical protein
MREPYLYTDFAQSNSLPAVFDSDLENFWTQKSKFKSMNISRFNLNAKLTFKHKNI